MTGAISIFEVFTIAIGVALGVFIGLMLFAWETGLKRAVQAWLEDRAEVRIALHTIDRYEQKQNDPEYQRLDAALGDPAWETGEREDVEAAWRRLGAAGATGVPNALELKEYRRRVVDERFERADREAELILKRKRTDPAPPARSGGGGLSPNRR